MKTINKFLCLTLGVSALVMTSCDDLNTKPEGSTITQGQKDDAIEANPELMAADVAAMYAKMIACAGVTGDEDYHFDFGNAAASLMLDNGGQDMICANIDYNWFSSSADFSDRVYNHAFTSYMWSLFYKQIYIANSVIGSIPANTDDAELKIYRGQALAIRAYNYMQLAQTHQFTYIGHQDKPCVPIVTDETTEEQGMNNPRATVEAVYTLIMKDLNEAITLLDKYKRPDNGYVDQSVTYGLRARTNLLMGKYAEAASDADQALTLSGAIPYTKKDVSSPAFWNATDKTVMWANIVVASNRIVTSGIINAPSHLCTFYTDGYTGVGAWKKISKLLYDRIPSKDVRKGWWLDENLKSPLTEGEAYTNWFKKVIEGPGAEMFGPYTNVKFGADDNNLSTLSPAQDWFLMRAEEMIFIKAEGLAKSGKLGEAKSVLESFIKENRYEDYECTASSADAMVDEIWFQRRVELWGEGFSYYDVMRLKKPLTRISNKVSNFPDDWQYNVEAESPILLYLVPKSEIEANKGISENDNNEVVAPPRK